MEWMDECIIIIIFSIRSLIIYFPIFSRDEMKNLYFVRSRNADVVQNIYGSCTRPGAQDVF